MSECHIQDKNIQSSYLFSPVMKMKENRMEKKRKKRKKTLLAIMSLLTDGLVWFIGV